MREQIISGADQNDSGHDHILDLSKKSAVDLPGNNSGDHHPDRHRRQDQSCVRGRKSVHVLKIEREHIVRSGKREKEQRQDHVHDNKRSAFEHAQVDQRVFVVPLPENENSDTEYGKEQ